MNGGAEARHRARQSVAQYEADLATARRKGAEEGYARGFSDGMKGAFAAANVVNDMVRALPTEPDGAAPAPGAEPKRPTT